ncbi:hypothetical protein PUMCH_001644 [Australozyma saopauloensis]|uniref:SGNH hydrolase-type esterase domain-containing protein n=1 Tax=Australozyma saopauloensis TaxID=291208 RepID=A0AAX4H7B4_9ASCO|nr:hypothetical protein PUMCH_001644 [[Candida] saopauloensis]
MYTIGKFVLFGDSITQHSSDLPESGNGFVLAPALQSLYARKLDIVTRGFSGYNTNQTKVVLRETLKADHAETGAIKLMSIFMGTNDAAFNFQGVPIDAYKANLQEMVRLAQLYNIKLIIVGPALHGRAECLAASEAQGLEPNFSDTVATRKYADAAASVAASNGVPFVDLWNSFQKFGGWSAEDLLQGKVVLKELLPDGIHFSPQAYRIMYDELLKVIAKNYPELVAENLPMYFPAYDAMDSDNIEESILEYAREHAD